jgi:two-component system, NtrC family, response regulator AtoC
MNAKPLLILLVDDDEVVHATIGGYLRAAGHRVWDAFDGAAAVQQLEKQEYDLALSDIQMPLLDGLAFLAKAQEVRPDLPVVLITGHGTMETVIEALRLGAADFLSKPFDLRELDAVIEKCLRIGSLRKEKRHLRATLGGLQTLEDRRGPGRTFIGASEASRRVREQIRQAVAAGCDSLLVLGETGTGKEVVAREFHFQACSDDSPFIAVSCPALPDTLVESELFGHVKGAFTGAAQDRAGYFELADGGTLFLDEVGDLSPAAQAKLLRVLETRTVRRVGGSDETHVAIRVVAATNTPLAERAEAGTFRRDLYYRLNVFAIHLPPLRERPDDILPLADHFLSAYAAARGRRLEGFAPEAQATLLAYDFPGNARELRNLVERAAILCPGGPIQPEHLALRDRADPPAASSSPSPLGGGEGGDAGDERSHLLRALHDARWNRRRAAAALGMPYSTLRYKLKNLHIE